MQNVTRHVGKLEIIKRLESSYFGNPRYLVELDGIVCKSIVNSGEAYGPIPNNDGRIVTAKIGMHYGHAHISNTERIKA